LGGTDPGDHPRETPAGTSIALFDDGAQAIGVFLWRCGAVALALVPKHHAESLRTELKNAFLQPVEQVAARLPLLDPGCSMPGDRHADRHLVTCGHRVAERRPETAHVSAVMDVWRRGGVDVLVEREQAQLRQRMGDVSPFMKLLKQRYSISYNQRHKRTGTLWEGRYASIMVEGESRALSAIAAYIDLNPVRAGIVKDPAAYRWSGYGEACGGSDVARQGIIAVQSSIRQTQDTSWSDAAAAYRTNLFTRGEERRDEGGKLLRVGFSLEVAQEVIDQGGRLPLPDLLRCRVRYFRDGLAFGSKAFVESVFERNRAHFGAKRKTGARKIRFCLSEEFCTARDLRVAPISVPLRA